jgi:hypothetical protein
MRYRSMTFDRHRTSDRQRRCLRGMDEAGSKVTVLRFAGRKW